MELPATFVRLKIVKIVLYVQFAQQTYGLVDYNMHRMNSLVVDNSG